MQQKADYIFKNAIVLTMDQDYTFYEPGGVAIKDDTILAVGPEADIVIEVGVKTQRQILRFAALDIAVTQIQAAVAQGKFPGTEITFRLDAVEAAFRAAVGPGFPRQHPAAVDVPAAKFEFGGH